jgi:hypothetical protein
MFIVTTFLGGVVILISNNAGMDLEHQFVKYQRLECKILSTDCELCLPPARPEVSFRALDGLLSERNHVKMTVPTKQPHEKILLFTYKHPSISCCGSDTLQ